MHQRRINTLVHFALLGYLYFPACTSPVPQETALAVAPPATAYIFGYRSDDGTGTTQHRHEESDGAGVIKGSYGFVDPDGVYRTVNYTADANGYRAVVRSNEPTFEAQKTGNVVFIAASPPPVVPPTVRRRRKPTAALNSV